MSNFSLTKSGTNSAFAALAVLFWVTLWPSDGFARSETWCHVSDPKDPTLNVREYPAGKVVNQLSNQRVVRLDHTQTDAAGRTWAEVSAIYHGNWRNWGWVFRKHLQCIDLASLPREKLSVNTLRAAGIVPQAVYKTQTLPVSCDEVPNGWGVTISNQLFDIYKQRGFSREAVCLALGSDDVHFDPETGRRLKLYQISNDEFQQVRALWLPDCFKEVEIVAKGGWLVGWRPHGCTMRFHPLTGFPIDNPELVELSAGGEAGGGVDEDNQSSTVSADRLRSLVNGK
jgi:hypothetical protein